MSTVRKLLKPVRQPNLEPILKPILSPIVEPLSKMHAEQGLGSLRIQGSLASMPVKLLSVSGRSS